MNDIGQAIGKNIVNQWHKWQRIYVPGNQDSFASWNDYCG